MKKVTAIGVGDMIDFSGSPHGSYPYTWFSTGNPCGCDRCVKARGEIAESLSLDGTKVAS